LVAGVPAHFFHRRVLFFHFQPGPHKETYATATLTICIITTVVCGGFTERVLTIFELREETTPKISDSEDDMDLTSLTYKPPVPKRRESMLEERKRYLTEGIKGVWYRFDENFLQIHFGGESASTDQIGHHGNGHHSNGHHGNGDAFHGNGTNGNGWSGSYERGHINGNGTPRTQEMISLTSSIDEEEHQE
jgi:hypothetical protein